MRRGGWDDGRAVITIRTQASDAGPGRTVTLGVAAAEGSDGSAAGRLAEQWVRALTRAAQAWREGGGGGGGGDRRSAGW